MSSEQYALLLTALNTTMTIALEAGDVEVSRVCHKQMHRLADEVQAKGYTIDFNTVTQSYIVLDNQDQKA